MFVFPFADENPTNKIPIFNWLIIFICSITFLKYIFEHNYVQEQLFVSFGMIPAVLFGYSELSTQLQIIPAYMTIITSMFLHGGWMHLIGNMMYLYIFGDNIEDKLGKAKFLVFYLITGIIAALTQALLDPSSTIPVIGASGAIAGILGGYLVMYPKANIKVFFWFIIFFKVFRIRAFIVLVGWILIQFFSFSGEELNSGGVAYGAHIGGFVSGAILIKFFYRKQRTSNRPFKGSVPNAK
jgi:membrane associated rhomboid family serine protease